MAKKLDMSRIKNLLLEKGERLALIVVAAVVLLILILGIFGPMAPSTSPPAKAGDSSWHRAIMKQVKAMEQSIEGSRPAENDIPKVQRGPDYPSLYAGTVALLAPRVGVVQVLSTAARIQWASLGFGKDDDGIQENPAFALGYVAWFEDAINTIDERINPLILPVGTSVTEDLREIQVDYVPAPALTLDVNFGRREFMAVSVKGDKAARPAVLMEPRRMVVVWMTVPIKEQLEMFRQALRYPTVSQMLSKGEGPRDLGLNVFRSQIGPDGKETQPLPLYRHDAKEDKIIIGLGMTGTEKISDALDTFFRKMQVDTHNHGLLKGYIGPNMVTPLPALAAVKGTGSYPRLNLSGIDVPKDESDDPKQVVGTKPENPFGQFKQPEGKKANPAQPEKDVGGTTVTRPWKDLPAELHARLKGNYNVFHPLAAPLGADAKDDKKTFIDLAVPKGPKPKMNDDTRPQDQEITRLLARFIDVEAEVGKTYRYYIQVRVANPNFGKNEEVSHLDLAKIPELASGWAMTPWITVPPEAFFYAVDQKSFPDGLESKEVKDGNDKDKLDPERTAVQIHRWIGQTGEGGTERLIGDWVVAERLVIRRGEPISRKRVLVEAPEWNPTKARFELGFHVGSKVKGAAKSSGVPIDFVLGNPPPILVDFHGGRHEKYKVGRLPFKDDAAAELLVLTPEGNLIVRNSRIDGDPETEPGRERQMRYSRWRNRVEAVRDLPSSSGTGTKSAFPK